MNNEYRVEKWNADTLPIASDLRRQMEDEGYSVHQWSDAPGIVYSMHEHSDEQSHWIISGRLELTIEHLESFVLEPGDRDFMPARTRHAALVIGDEPASYLIGSRT